VAVPVQIVSGFLGAGKTTAIRAQLDALRGERVAVIVNDFGEARIDEAALAENEPFRITNIPGGCVCCTAPEGFVEALAAVLAERPDRLLIEPTGLARPQDLIDTIRRCPQRDALALQPVVVLVDPAALRQLEAEGGSESLTLLREQAQDPARRPRRGAARLARGRGRARPLRP
jgi:G3E family GTPase